MIKKSTIPTLLGIILLLVGSFAGVFLLKSTQIFKIGADVSSNVKNIRVSNISEDTATISWTTDKETADFIVWGNSQKALNKTENEGATEQKYFNHSITLTGLNPETVYFYKINSDGNLFDNGGIPWQFTTGPAIGLNKNSVIVSGSVINATGQPEKRVLIYADIGGYLLSTLTSDTGNYIFQIGSVRTSDLKSYAQIDLKNTLIQLSVQAAPDGVASAQIYPKSANPSPPIIVGQVYDFRNEPENNLGDSPSANLSLPQDNAKDSKFNVDTNSLPSKPTTVILESLSEGETLTTTKPQFFGKGPSGATLTITVHSQNPISGSVQVPKNGSWSFAVPENLDPGTHSITISWVDVSGITRFLTRDFVVKAGEVPAFTASQSGATATPTSVPTLAPTTGPQATVSPTAKPSAIPTASPVSTDVPVPETGDLTPTLLLFMIGLAVMVFSFTVWKVSKI